MTFKAKTQNRSNILAICNKHVSNTSREWGGSFFADKRKSAHRSNIDGWSIKYYQGTCDDMPALNTALKPFGVIAEYVTATSRHSWGYGVTSIQIFRVEG